MKAAARTVLLVLGVVALAGFLAPNHERSATAQGSDARFTVGFFDPWFVWYATERRDEEPGGRAVDRRDAGAAVHAKRWSLLFGAIGAGALVLRRRLGRPVG